MLLFEFYSVCSLRKKKTYIEVECKKVTDNLSLALSFCFVNSVLEYVLCCLCNKFLNVLSKDKKYKK